MTDQLKFLTTLESVIRNRIESDSDSSYTARLVSSGQSRVAQKVGEEALELALAATSGSASEQLDEAADLVFHLLVLLHTLGLSLGDVAAKLNERHRNAASP